MSTELGTSVIVENSVAVKISVEGGASVVVGGLKGSKVPGSLSVGNGINEE